MRELESQKSFYNFYPLNRFLDFFHLLSKSIVTLCIHPPIFTNLQEQCIWRHHFEPTEPYLQALAYRIHFTLTQHFCTIKPILRSNLPRLDEALESIFYNLSITVAHLNTAAYCKVFFHYINGILSIRCNALNNSVTMKLLIYLNK